MIADRKNIKADGKDLSFVTVRVTDEQGNFCPLANNLINFTIEGDGEIVAVGNGNAATTEPFNADCRKAFNGMCLVIVKSSFKIGKTNLIAKTDGLETVDVEISFI